MAEKKYALGIDIGGSHISCVAMDMQTLTLKKETLKREKLSHTDTATNIFKTWATAINACAKEVGVENVAGLGFAIPGPFNYQEGISLMEHKYPNLFQMHLPTELKKFLVVDFPMRFINDAAAFSVGVCWLDVAKDFEKVVVITLGTGLGSAYVKGGIPQAEGENIAPQGCFWHLPFADGIADEYFTTRWFVKRYKELTGKEVAGAKEVISAVEAPELFNEFANNLGDFLAPWLRKYGTEMLVLGGNISLAYSHFEKPFKQKLQAHGCEMPIAVSELMEDAAVVGAARLFEPSFWEKMKDNLSQI